MAEMTVEKKSDMRKDSVTFKLIAVGVLILVLLIPSSMISSLVNERKQRRDQAISEISSTWASGQRITGPVIVIPVRRKVKNDRGQWVVTNDVAQFLPEKLSISSSLEPEIRRRGIYETVVYTSTVGIHASFTRPSFSSMGIEPADVLWDQAAVTIGIADMKGIKGTGNLRWNDQPIDIMPGSRAPSIAPAGVSAAVALGENSSQLTASLELKGSSELTFVPMGKETAATLTSPWAHPSFRGAFLPERREVSKSGFQADWRVSHLNRNFPQQWVGADHQIDASVFGVSLLRPVDHYSNTSRSTKYSVLFVFLTFLVFFFIEFMIKRRLHPIQYLMVGAGLVLFYLLLLSLSEHMPFVGAYIAATVATVSLLTGYAHGVFQRPKITGIVAGILVTLYFFLYCLLQLEDYALLIGGTGLFVALATAMYITRKIDWYQS